MDRAFQMAVSLINTRIKLRVLRYVKLYNKIRKLKKIRSGVYFLFRTKRKNKQTEH